MADKLSERTQILINALFYRPQIGEPERRRCTEIVEQALREVQMETENRLTAELAARETNAEAKLRLAEVEVANLKYHIRELITGTAKRPWRWVKKFEMGHRKNHWCLESVPEPDNGAGDGHERTVGIILTDYWSQHPTPLMLFVQDELNRSGQRAEQLAAKDEQIKALREVAKCCENLWAAYIVGNVRMQAEIELGAKLSDIQQKARAALKKLDHIRDTTEMMEHMEKDERMEKLEDK